MIYDECFTPLDGARITCETTWGMIAAITPLSSKGKEIMARYIASKKYVDKEQETLQDLVNPHKEFKNVVYMAEAIASDPDCYETKTHVEVLIEQYTEWTRLVDNLTPLIFKVYEAADSFRSFNPVYNSKTTVVWRGARDLRYMKEIWRTLVEAFHFFIDGNREEGVEHLSLAIECFNDFETNEYLQTIFNDLETQLLMFDLED